MGDFDWERRSLGASAREVVPGVSARARHTLKAAIEKAATARGVSPGTYLAMMPGAGYKTVVELLGWLGLPDPEGAWAARWKGQQRRARRARKAGR